MSGIAKRVAWLSDGRELIYFDDADTTLPPERKADERPPEPRPPVPQLRLDPPPEPRPAGPEAAARPPDRGVDLHRARPPEPRVPAARGPRSAGALGAGAADGDTRQLRCRGVREQVPLV